MSPFHLLQERILWPGDSLIGWWRIFVIYVVGDLGLILYQFPPCLRRRHGVGGCSFASLIPVKKPYRHQYNDNYDDNGKEDDSVEINGIGSDAAATVEEAFRDGCQSERLTRD